MNILEESFLNMLINRCALMRDHRACKAWDLYVAYGRIHARLERALEDLGLNLPIKPEPAPQLKWLLDGDPDGSPARIFPTAGSTSDRVRLQSGLESAEHLRATLIKVVSALEGDIKELEQMLGE